MLFINKGLQCNYFCYPELICIAGSARSHGP